MSNRSAYLRRITASGAVAAALPAPLTTVTTAVMRDGRAVEMNTARQVFRNPQHPYTRTLPNTVPGTGREIPEALRNRHGSSGFEGAGRGAAA